MPTLDRIGKKAVLDHHRDVPHRLLPCDSQQVPYEIRGRARWLEAPERVSRVRDCRIVAQRTLEMDSKVYLVRVFVDIDREPAEIETAYRTSKIRKYGGAP